MGAMFISDYPIQVKDVKTPLLRGGEFCVRLPCNVPHLSRDKRDSEANMRKAPFLLILVLACLLLQTSVSGQTGAQSGEWRTYGGDLGNTHYSPLDQINASNFNKLTVAWTFKTDNLGPRPEFQFEGTPLMANGVLYSTAGTRRAVIALDPATG